MFPNLIFFSKYLKIITNLKIIQVSFSEDSSSKITLQILS